MSSYPIVPVLMPSIARKDALSSVAVVVYIVVSTPCLLFQVVIPTAQTMDNELTMTVAWAVKT